MPRKFFRKFLPTYEALRTNRYILRLGPWAQHPNLWRLNRRSVAGAVAAGLFTGLIPGSNPVQFTAAALLAVAARVNLPVAVLVTLYSNFFTVVPLLYVAFKLGQLVLLENGQPLPSFALEESHRTFNEWMPAALHWIVTVGKPLLVGLPLLGLLLAIVGYFAVDWTWQLYVRCTWAARKRRRLESSR